MLVDSNSEKVTGDGKSVIFWWPNSVFQDFHWKKDPGSIPLELARIGYAVTMVVGLLQSKLKPEEIRVVETFDKLRQKQVFNLIERVRSIKYLLELVRQCHPRAVIIKHNEVEALIFALLLKLRSSFTQEHLPCLILKLDVDPDTVNNKNPLPVIYRYVYSKYFDKIVCESECAYSQLVKPKPIIKYKNKYSVIPDGFYYDDKKGARTIEMRKYKRILSVGRISYQKGHDILIQIFAKIVNKYPDWELRIVGLSGDQKYKKTLEEEITSLGVGNSVKLLTDLNEDDLNKEYEEASIFCLLSRYESFGIARSEAIYHGLPMVITEAGCGTYYERFGSFVRKISDEKGIIDALEKLILDENLRKEISERQRSAIMNWHEVALELSKLIEAF